MSSHFHQQWRVQRAAFRSVSLPAAVCAAGRIVAYLLRSVGVFVAFVILGAASATGKQHVGRTFVEAETLRAVYGGFQLALDPRASNGEYLILDRTPAVIAIALSKPIATGRSVKLFLRVRVPAAHAPASLRVSFGGATSTLVMPIAGTDAAWRWTSGLLLTATTASSAVELAFADGDRRGLAIDCIYFTEAVEEITPPPVPEGGRFDIARVQDFYLAGREVPDVSPGMTFYADFDGSASAVFSAGDGRVANPGTAFNYRPGIAGQGILVSERELSFAPEYPVGRNLSATEGAIAFWFRPEWDAADPIVGRSPNRWCFSTRGGAGRMYLYCLRSTVAVDYFVRADTAGWQRGEWHHIALVWSATQIIVYLDGWRAAHTAFRREWRENFDAGDTFIVGSNHDGLAAGGVIDEFAIWGRPLSPREVAAVFVRGLRGENLLSQEQRQRARDIRAAARSAPVTDVNVLRDGSFEGGAGHWFQANVPPASNASYPSAAFVHDPGGPVRVVDDVAFHGTRSLRVKLDGARDEVPGQGAAEFRSLAFRLTPEQKFRASAWVMSDSGAPMTVELSLVPMKHLGDRHAALTRVETLTASGNWTRIEVTGVPPEAYDDLYRLMITIRQASREDTHAYLDALQVSPAEAVAESSGYRTIAPLVAALSTGQLANIFDFGTAPSVNVELTNQSDIETIARVVLEVRDLSERVVVSRSMTHAVTAAGRVRLDVPVPGHAPGIFHALLKESVSSVVLDEMTYSILPNMRHTSLGILVTHDAYSQRVARRIGVAWNRLWDNGRATDWANVQPVDSEGFDWRYSDAIVDASIRNGFTPMGTLAWPQSRWAVNWVARTRPHWLHAEWNPAGTDAVPENRFYDPVFRGLWARYVREVVSRYRDRIQYWELLNEPYLEHSAEWTADLYAFTVPIIRQANPDAVVVGPSTHVRDAWMETLLKRGLLRHVDVFSFHGYGMSVESLAKIQAWAGADGRKRRLFDSENNGHSSSRLWCSSCQGVEFTGHHPPRRAAARMAKSYVRERGAGVDVYFYYWMIPYDAYEKFGSLFSFDGTLRPPAVAYAVAAWILRDVRPVQSLLIGGRVRCYIFKNASGARSIAAVWTEDESSQRMVLGARAKAIRRYDQMGARTSVAGGPAVIEVSEFPVYLESQSIDDLMQALGQATLVDR